LLQNDSPEDPWTESLSSAFPAKAAPNAQEMCNRANSLAFSAKLLRNFCTAATKNAAAPHLPLQEGPGDGYRFHKGPPALTFQASARTQ
jgi:hypothetical protein